MIFITDVQAPDQIKPMKHHILYIVLVFALCLPASAQEGTDYYRADFFRYHDHIYKKNIKTVLLYRAGWELSLPILQMGAGEKLHLSFDDLDADVKDYGYTIIHCDANWKPSDLKPNEYLDGFMEAPIRDYQSSFNTIQSYTHYDLIIPNDDMSFKLSGNYLLKVFENDTSDVAITLRFMVSDPRVNVEGHVKRDVNVEERNYRQQVTFTLDTKGFDIYEPYRNLNVVIMQNYRTDNAITNLKPMMVNGDRLDYTYDSGNTFNGANEFRNIDIKSLRYQSARIKSFDFENRQNQIYLWDDDPRTFKVYRTEDDINGSRLISCDEGDDPGADCDYAEVHFHLTYPTPLADGNLYIFGALTNWQYIPEARMRYDNAKKGYDGILYLKEGFYDYCYMFLENGSSTGDPTLIEGNHYETGNDYLILIYYRAPGLLYDQLIGVKTLDSHNNP
jgi:hypothetical protein